jgi:hypothetical protein
VFLFPGSWAVFQFVTSLLFWLIAMMIHIFYIDSFEIYIDSFYTSSCVCDLPMVRALPAEPTEVEKKAWALAQAERKEKCSRICPTSKKEDAPTEVSSFTDIKDVGEVTDGAW